MAQMLSPRPGVELQEHTTFKPIAPIHKLAQYKVLWVVLVGDSLSRIAADRALFPSHTPTRQNQEMHRHSLDKPDEFWREQAHQYLQVSRDTPYLMCGLAGYVIACKSE